MPEVIDAQASHRTEVAFQDGKLFVNKIYNNQKALEQNKLIRSHGFMDRGELGIHDKADIRMGISVPSVAEWTNFKKNNPDIYAQIKSKDEAERMKGCQRLQMIEPEWVVQERL